MRSKPRQYHLRQSRDTVTSYRETFLVADIDNPLKDLSATAKRMALGFLLFISQR